MTTTVASAAGAGEAEEDEEGRKRRGDGAWRSSVATAGVDDERESELRTARRRRASGGGPWGQGAAGEARPLRRAYIRRSYLELEARRRRRE